MIRIENKIYQYDETGEWLLCGEVVMGIDGEYIEWFE